MNKKNFFLFLSFSALGIKELLKGIREDFVSRKRFQKIVYLLQEISSFPLSYRYNLYIYGPYSPDLTKDLFLMSEDFSNLNALSADYTLKEEITKKITQIKDDILDVRPASMDEVDWIELVATYHYLASKKYFDEDECKKYIEANKGHLSVHVDEARKVVDNIVPRNQGQ
ncbi:MAG: hypothetical protein LBR69_08100 [Endomicrobium sp.]|jgi:uncharacterized protein YwgA|nr:hypothetical protein [Endomicrobium sp.]